MIPKKLHFIWFGKKPSYCDNAIRYFKLYNNFEIYTYFKTVQDIELIADTQYEKLNKCDQLIKKCIDAILNMNTKYNAQINRSKNIFKMNFIQVLADIFRLEILNEYGGIYLDCDTFPIKPFDNTLLNNDQFVVSRHMLYTNNIMPDYYFIGKSITSKKITSYFNIQKTILQTYKNWWNNLTYIQNKYYFFKNKMFNICNKNIDFYIAHYNDNTWIKQSNGQNRTPKCKFDNI